MARLTNPCPSPGHTTITIVLFWQALTLKWPRSRLEYIHQEGKNLNLLNSTLCTLHLFKLFSLAHRNNHGAKTFWTSLMDESLVDPAPDSHVPISQFFSEGNGGEFRYMIRSKVLIESPLDKILSCIGEKKEQFAHWWAKIEWNRDMKLLWFNHRKSYHGYPSGMAQLLDSPASFHIQPMQIDTKNRDYNGTDFKAGILPKASAAPPNASYSGLLECPCTTRYTLMQLIKKLTL